MSKTVVNPYSDVFVRYLLGDEANKDLLISFINAVNEDYDLPTITDVNILSPYNFNDILMLKDTILDVKAEDEFGKLYNIEIQVQGDETYKSRALYYWAKLYSSQLDKGESYTELQPTISINLINFDLTKNDNFHSAYGIKELGKNDDLLLTNHFLMHFIEIEKFIKESNFSSKMENWLAFFKYEGKREDIMRTIIENDPYISKAHNRFTRFTQDEKMMEIYNSREKFEHDRVSEIFVAEKKGKIEGEKKGKSETALVMKADGLPTETIMKYTGLTKDEIEKL